MTRNTLWIDIACGIKLSQLRGDRTGNVVLSSCTQSCIFVTTVFVITRNALWIDITSGTQIRRQKANVVVRLVMQCWVHERQKNICKTHTTRRKYASRELQDTNCYLTLLMFSILRLSKSQIPLDFVVNMRIKHHKMCDLQNVTADFQNIVISPKTNFVK